MLADVVVTALTVFGVIMVAAIVFFVWLAATLIGTFFRVLRWLARIVFPQPVQQHWRTIEVRPVESVRPCERPRCGAENPAEARYCRRCGKKMARRCATRCERVAVRRVAMW